MVTPFPASPYRCGTHQQHHMLDTKPAPKSRLQSSQVTSRTNTALGGSVHLFQQAEHDRVQRGRQLIGRQAQRADCRVDLTGGAALHVAEVLLPHIRLRRRHPVCQNRQRECRSQQRGVRNHPAEKMTGSESGPRRAQTSPGTSLEGDSSWTMHLDMRCASLGFHWLRPSNKTTTGHQVPCLPLVSGCGRNSDEVTKQRASGRRLLMSDSTRSRSAKSAMADMPFSRPFISWPAGSKDGADCKAAAKTDRACF